MFSMFTPQTFNIFHVMVFSVIALFISILLFNLYIAFLDKFNIDPPDYVDYPLILIFIFTIFSIFDYKTSMYYPQSNSAISNITALSYMKDQLEKNDPIVEVLKLQSNHKYEAINFDLSNKVIYNMEIIRQYWGNQIVLLSYLEDNNNKIENKKIAIITTNDEYKDLREKMYQYPEKISNWTQKLNSYIYNTDNINKILNLKNIPWNFIPD